MVFGVKVNSIDEKKWANFVDNHPNGSVFQHPRMKLACEKIKNITPIVLSIEEDGELQIVLLVLIQKEGGGVKGLFTSRAVIMGGPVYREFNSKYLDAVLGRLKSVMKSSAIYTQFRNMWAVSEKERPIFEKNGFIYKAHLDILHDLNKPVLEQFNLIHSGRRKNIRRAEKAGLTIRFAESNKDFMAAYNLIKLTYTRIRLPLPDISYFDAIWNAFKDGSILKVFLCELEGTIIATRMVFCYNDHIYDWYAGSDDNYLDKYPNDYLPWAVMKWGTENGFKKFDFGGAGSPDKKYGVRDYKLKFGGDLVEFGRFEIIHKPLLMATGKIGLKLYKKLHGLLK